MTHPFTPIVARVLSVCVLATLVVAGAIALDRFAPRETLLERYADSVLASCADSSYKPDCYDKEIPKLMDRGLSMEEAFEVTKVVQDKAGGYFYCHVLGHRLSERETAKDPTKWTEVIARCPTGMCSNGCLHGAAQERFRASSLSDEQVAELIPELKNICESGNGRDYTGLEQASCFHSLGHLAMYVTDADVALATEVCDAVSAKSSGGDYSRTCYEGVYMQIFQPLEPEDFALIKAIEPKTQKDAEAFCDSFAGERRAACHRESWPLYRSALMEPGGLESFCSLVPDKASKKNCYTGLFYVLAALLNFDEEKITPFCLSVPPERVGQCFANSASRFIETDYRLTPQAVELCEVAEREGVGERCYRELLFYSFYNFHKGSDAFKALCNALPEPWSSECLAGKGESVHISAEDDGP